MISIKTWLSRWCRGTRYSLFRSYFQKSAQDDKRHGPVVSHETSSELEEVHGRKKRAEKPWPAWDKSSADVAHNPCVRPLEGRLAVARLAVSVFAIRFARVPRNAALGFAASSPLTASFLPFFHSLFLSRSFLIFWKFFFFLLFSLPLFFSTSSFLVLRLPCLYASAAFLFIRPWIDPGSSSLCIWFAFLLLVNRFPFFVKASDTLIRCVVLFVYLPPRLLSRPFEI